MRILDISQPVGGESAVWPGDRPFRLDWTMRLESGDSVNVAALSLSAHTGTHVDGPLHIRSGAPAIGLQPLEAMIGPARVVDARGRNELGGEMMQRIDHAHRRVERVLFRTLKSGAAGFPSRFAAITPELARGLVAARIRLVGTDAPSVDPFDSKTLEAHGILVDGGVTIVEGLVLNGVAAGDYTLVVLPLRLIEADSSPARAVLLEET